MPLALLLPLFLAQAPASFDIASVKPVDIRGLDSYTVNLGKTLHGELTLGNASLADCVKFAYGLTSDIQLAGPEWIWSKMIRFDIVAHAAPETSREQLLLMLRNLLDERFKLAVHHEQKQASYLALALAKKGLKMEEAEANAPLSNNQFRPGHIVSKGVYMPMLANVLSRFLREPVIDFTGLKTRYVIDLTWTPEAADGITSGSETGSGPSIYTALQQQLGLKLESRKGLIDVLVVDHAERVPVEN